MQDAHARKPDGPAPDSDATSNETLADLERSEQDSESESADATAEPQLPAPDGINDETPEKPDEAGPM
jgi:hypothetical protein